MSFAALGLSAEIQRALEEKGYREPTPIQAQAIPVVLSGGDIMAGAQTGTGKTAAFTLPILHRLQPHASASTSPARHPVRALVLTPTRELAAQVEASVKAYGKYLPLRSSAVFGGVNIAPQTQALRNGVEILVATPGRLLDHVQQKTVNLSQVEILVLDEADRMLDMGFLPDISRILMLLPARRQNMLFSATFSSDIKRLSDSFMKSPTLIEVAQRNTASERVTQRIHPVDRARKRELLAHLIKSRDMRQVIVFTATKTGCDRLSHLLVQDGINAAPIHGDRNQTQRTQALADFKDGAVRVLVATDIAARGLDIDLLPFVVNFDLPRVPEDYVHRIGRTGRAGSEGEAISLVSADEERSLADIERLLQRTLEREPVPGFEPGSSVAVAEPSRVRHGRR
ncbi:MAG: DEAD/DEAH box helicase, partial [Sulfuricellaceae bacterium]|nr:DEAD/DEAH box helicase [Sulfuricellaceae bacterium]